MFMSSSSIRDAGEEFKGHKVGLVTSTGVTICW